MGKVIILLIYLSLRYDEILILKKKSTWEVLRKYLHPNVYVCINKN